MTDKVDAAPDVTHGADTEDAGLNPLFSFGAISDVQYADIPNHLNYTKTCMRYYRDAAVKVQEAALTWNEDDTNKPSFTVHLGDLIDGFNSKEGKANSEKVLQDILIEFDKFDGPIHHVLGNHEFYNFTRNELFNGRLNTSKLDPTSVTDASSSDQDTDQSDKSDKCGCKQRLYYKFNPHPDFCFIVLDTYDISVLGHVEDCPHHAEAMETLCAVNKNEGFMLNSAEGLVGLEQRYVKYNGGIGEEQLLWLKMVLQEATEKDQRVFILCHIPLFPGTNLPNLLWNYEEILETLHTFHCVVAVLCGHFHEFCQDEDPHGIHHIIFPGIVEVAPGGQGFAILDVFNQRCRVRGFGQMPSFEMEFKMVPNEGQIDKMDGCYGKCNETNDDANDGK